MSENPVREELSAAGYSYNQPQTFNGSVTFNGPVFGIAAANGPKWSYQYKSTSGGAFNGSPFFVFDNNGSVAAADNLRVGIAAQSQLNFFGPGDYSMAIADQTLDVNGTPLFILALPNVHLASAICHSLSASLLPPVGTIDMGGNDLDIASGQGTGGGVATSINFSTPDAGIPGTATPQTMVRRMRINAAGVEIPSLIVTGGSPGLGKVFTSDAVGVGSWQTAPAASIGNLTAPSADYLKIQNPGIGNFPQNIDIFSRYWGVNDWRKFSISQAVGDDVTLGTSQGSGTGGSFSININSALGNVYLKANSTGEVSVWTGGTQRVGFRSTFVVPTTDFAYNIGNAGASFGVAYLDYIILHNHTTLSQGANGVLQIGTPSGAVNTAGSVACTDATFSGLASYSLGGNANFIRHFRASASKTLTLGSNTNFARVNIPASGTCTVYIMYNVNVVDSNGEFKAHGGRYAVSIYRKATGNVVAGTVTETTETNVASVGNNLADTFTITGDANGVLIGTNVTVGTGMAATPTGTVNFEITAIGSVNTLPTISAV